MAGNVPDLGARIDQIYQAAVAPEKWPVFLEALREELAAKTLHLSARLPCDGDQGLVLSLGMEERFEDAYRSHFHLMDPWMPLLGAEKEGETLGLEDLVSDGSLTRTEFYNDWMRPQDIFYGFGALLQKSGSWKLVASLSGFREKSRGPFGKEDLEKVRPLVPHLQRALVVQRRIQAAEMRAAAAQDVLDRACGGVILLDERGGLVAANRTAERILGLKDGLSLDREGPAASTAEQTATLRRLLSKAAATGAGRGRNPGGVLHLSRPSGHPDLEIVITPIRRESLPLFDRRVTSALFVTDPEVQAERLLERVRRIYGLTAVEGEVASRLAGGMRLREIGEALGVSIHTVRGHLKQLFVKTGTHRQPDLVRVLLAGPALLSLE